MIWKLKLELIIFILFIKKLQEDNGDLPLFTHLSDVTSQYDINESHVRHYLIGELVVCCIRVDEHCVRVTTSVKPELRRMI